MTLARRLLTASGSGGGITTPIPAYTVDFAWLGNVSDEGVTIKLRSTDATAVVIKYSTSPDLSAFSSATGTEGADDVWTVTLAGLAADTQYYFGFLGSSLTGQFRTFPTEGTTHSFLIVAGGDTGSSPQYPGATANVSNAPTWDRMLEHGPLLCLMLGDLHYRDLNTTSVAPYRTAFRDVLAEGNVADFVRRVPTAYVWDDHDFGPNNADGTYAGKAAAQQAYREYVPHWPLGDVEAIYHTFVVGRVRFVMLDVRSERTPNSATDDSSKTRLGADQKAWLAVVLTDATEPVIVMDVVSWIGDTTGFDDGWEAFSTERTELFDLFTTLDVMDRLFLIGGDIHELLADDGENTNFETGASSNGPPYCGFAPIDASFNDFSATAQQKYQTRQQQYGTMEFADTGTQITVTAKGWALSASPGATSSEQFSLAKVYPG